MAVPDDTHTFLENASDLPLHSRHHWASASQSYTPVVVFMQHLAEGWWLTPVVSAETYCRGGGRHITIYHFELRRGQRALLMRVKGNPVVRRFLRHYPCQIVSIHNDCE